MKGLVHVMKPGWSSGQYVRVGLSVLVTVVQVRQCASPDLRSRDDFTLFVTDADSGTKWKGAVGRWSMKGESSSGNANNSLMAVEDRIATETVLSRLLKKGATIKRSCQDNPLESRSSEHLPTSAC